MNRRNHYHAMCLKMARRYLTLARLGVSEALRSASAKTDYAWTDRLARSLGCDSAEAQRLAASDRAA